MNNGRYLFVSPRCGPDIGGGAESLIRTLGIELANCGNSVEIFTTCANDHRTWENVLPPGSHTDESVLVHRFPVNPRNIDIWLPLQIRISEGLALSIDEQLEWMKHGVNSDEMYNTINNRSDEFDYIFFGPYLFGTTFFGSQIAPEKSILIPCLHDESYAYLDIISFMFRNVRGAFFNAPPEAELAESIYGKIPGGAVGMGFTPAPINKTHSANLPEKFILYLGRKESGKNLPLLIDLFIGAKEVDPTLNELKLVIAGSGDFRDIDRNSALLREDILDLGKVDENTKSFLMESAIALCQPSINESFSIVLMESWLQKTPVLVPEECAVTNYHVVQSGGGLTFKNLEDFIVALRVLISNPNIRDDLGNAGFNYVKNQYSWPTVINRFNQLISYTNQIPS